MCVNVCVCGSISMFHADKCAIRPRVCLPGHSCGFVSLQHTRGQLISFLGNRTHGNCAHDLAHDLLCVAMCLDIRERTHRIRFHLPNTAKNQVINRPRGMTPAFLFYQVVLGLFLSLSAKCAHVSATARVICAREYASVVLLCTPCVLNE